MEINYLMEIRLFYDRMETTPIPPAAIVLWHSLMYLACKAGWPEELPVSIGTLMARSRLERRGVYRSRVALRDAGFIEFREQTGNRSALYKIIPQAGLQYNFDTQNVTQDEACGTELHRKVSHTEGERYKNVPQTVTQDGACGTELHRKMSHTEGERYKNAPQNVTQDEACGTKLHRKVSHTEGERYKNVPQTVIQIEPSDSEMTDKSLLNSCLTDTDDDCRSLSQSEISPIYIYNKDKDTDKGGCGGKKRKDGAKSKSTGNDAKSPKTKKPEFDLSFIGDGAWEALVSSWLEYKRSRSESYKSELSVKKFHTMLRNLSRGDPATARRIIDKSIANNWAGIFELTENDSRPRGQPSRPAAGHPATGQRIGQIKQPEDEERRRKLLEKFGGSGNASHSDDSAKNKT